MLHRLVEVDLLGGHGLRLHDDAGVLLTQDSQDEVARLFVGAGPVDFGAARLDIPHELFEMAVEMVDRLPLGLRGHLPRGLPILEGRLALVARNLVFAHRRLDGLAMPQVGRETAGILIELCGGRAHCWTSISAR